MRPPAKLIFKESYTPIGPHESSYVMKFATVNPCTLLRPELEIMGQPDISS